MSYLEKDVQDLLQALYESVDPETGEIRECDELAFKELSEECIVPKLERMQKARNYIKSDIKGVSEEIKRLQARKKSLEGELNRLSDRILIGLNAIGGKLKTALFTFSVRHDTSIVIADDAKIPPEFLKIETSVKKDDLKKHIQETGEIFDGVSFKETESLIVR